MLEPDPDMTSATREPVDEDLHREPRPDKPPVTSFDPHFGTRSGGTGHNHSDFDEMMWVRAA
jgi:hypothetical protein